MDWAVEHLGRDHDRRSFSCGKPPLDDFLAKYAGQYEKRNYARTYVAVRDGGPRVFGYYCLSCYGVPFENWPAESSKGLPRHQVPIVLLGRLAVDSSAQGTGLGGRLVRDALRRCVEVSRLAGVFAVLVEAIDEDAIRFYRHYGFAGFADQPDKLYLPVSTIAAG